MPDMGRQAKYYTAEERRLAKLEQARLYRSSSRYVSLNGPLVHTTLQVVN